MTRIVLSTGNIVSGGPSFIRKPGTYRSNLELTNSLRSNFAAAQQDYAAELENGNGLSNGAEATAANGVNGGSSRPALDVWTARETEKSGSADAPEKEKADSDASKEVLYIPRIDWAAAGLNEKRSQYEITLKFFFLPTAPAASRARYVEQALSLVTRELGVDSVDLFIASFPGMSFAGADCEWEADKRNGSMGDDAEEAATWTSALEPLHRAGRIGKLGIAEFGTDKLRRFLDSVDVRPSVDQINIKNCCDVPPPLTELAKKEKIELYTHSDCTDILPSGTLRELLGQGERGAGVLAADDEAGEGEASAGLRGNLVPEWVVKYTAFVKDRGVIENKGYFAGADLVEKKRKFDSLD